MSEQHQLQSKILTIYGAKIKKFSGKNKFREEIQMFYFSITYGQVNVMAQTKKTL